MINKSDVTTWLKDPVTQDFMERVNALLLANDDAVHDALSKIQPEQASLYNAGLDQLKEVLDLPAQMKIDIEEQADEREG